MVDSRPLHPESVIELARHQKGRNNPPVSGTEPPAPREGLGNFPLSLPFLLERLDAPSDSVKMWAAYQLMDRHAEETERFVGRLWESPLPEIRESALHLVSHHKLHQYAFPLLRIFHTDEGELRVAAGEALGRLRYEPAVKPLQEWFDWVFGSPEVSLLELESASRSLLLMDNWRNWEFLYGKLGDCRQNHSVFSVLFNTLALHAENPHQAERIAQAYGAPREAFHDFHLAQHLVEVFSRPNLSRYLQTRLNGGFSLAATYQEALRVLGIDVSDPELRLALEGLGACGKTQQGLERFVSLAGGLMEKLAPEEPDTPLLKALLAGCAGWIASWEEAVLKVREVEYHLVVSLPLVVALNRAERECLADPVGQAERIVGIYQSPLLSPTFMGTLLNLLSSQEGGALMARLGGGPLSGWLRDEEKDALWKLVTGQMEEVDYPFEQILPRPWEYRNPVVMQRLVENLKGRFAHYIQAGRKETVDYCLEVFRREGSAELLELLLQHFESLINFHHHGLLDVLTHLPEERFLQPLMGHYREGEDDLERLVRFICDVHHLPYPEVLKKEPPAPLPGRPPATVRLRCPSCDGSFQYVLEELYVNEERIEQRQVPAADDLWRPTPFVCKNCGAEVPLAPEAGFLSDLYSELLAARILHLTNKDESVLNHIHLIPFPLLRGKVCNPGRFLQEVYLDIATCREPGGEVPFVLELGKFYLEIGELEEAKRAFQRVHNGPLKSAIALYYLGVIAFQEKNPYEARIHFSRLLESCTREEFEQELDNPLDMARHYLKLLDKRDFKRSHFRILPS